MLIVIQRLDLDSSLCGIGSHLNRCNEILLMILSLCLGLMSLAILVGVRLLERSFVEILREFVVSRKRLVRSLRQGLILLLLNKHVVHLLNSLKTLGINQGWCHIGQVFLRITLGTSWSVILINTMPVHVVLIS